MKITCTDRMGLDRTAHVNRAHDGMEEDAHLNCAWCRREQHSRRPEATLDGKADSSEKDDEQHDSEGSNHPHQQLLPVLAQPQACQRHRVEYPIDAKSQNLPCAARTRELSSQAQQQQQQRVGGSRGRGTLSTALIRA